MHFPLRIWTIQILKDIQSFSNVFTKVYRRHSFTVTLTVPQTPDLIWRNNLRPINSPFLPNLVEILVNFHFHHIITNIKLIPRRYDYNWILKMNLNGKHNKPHEQWADEMENVFPTAVHEMKWEFSNLQQIIVISFFPTSILYFLYHKENFQTFQFSHNQKQNFT